MLKTSSSLLLAGTVVLLLSGCTSHTPVIDFRSSNRTMAEYERDLAECQALASQRSVATDAALGTVGGAAVGAGLGAAVGAITGSAGRGALLGTAIGGIGGGTAMAGNTASSQRDIINRCMAGRGYAVLD